MKPSFFKNLGPINASKIRSTILCELVNIKQSDFFNDFSSIDKIENYSLSFLYDNENCEKTLPKNSALICTETQSKKINSNQKMFLVKDVQEAVAKISNIFYRSYETFEKDKFNEPVIGESSDIANNAMIENGAIIGKNVKISAGAIIKCNCIIGDYSEIGANSVIENSILGDNTYVGSNSSIGQRGFGFHLNNDKNINIFHIGRVVLKSNVSIGSCCTIDRGSFSDTVIGKNTYIDNLCHIAHNVSIGNNCAFAAMTGIAGSAKIGDNVLTGGQVGISGHITIGNNVRIAAKSGVFNSLKDGESVMGNPAVNNYKFIKSYKKIYGKR